MKNITTILIASFMSLALGCAPTKAKETKIFDKHHLTIRHSMAAKPPKHKNKVLKFLESTLPPPEEQYHVFFISPQHRKKAFDFHNSAIIKKRNKITSKKRYKKNPSKLAQVLAKDKYQLRKQAQWGKSQDLQIVVLPGGIHETRTRTRYVTGYNNTLQPTTERYIVRFPNKKPVIGVKLASSPASAACKIKSMQSVDFKETQEYLVQNYLYQDLRNRHTY